jgi:hypothetical protein
VRERENLQRKSLARNHLENQKRVIIKRDSETEKEI